MDSISNFAKTVQAMRTAQKEYFKFRTTLALNDSKKKEKEVDILLEKILITNNQKQGSLM